MHRTLHKSVSGNHSLLVSDVDYKQGGFLFEKLEKNQVNLSELKKINNEARRIEWMTVRSVLLDYYEDAVDVTYTEHRKPMLLKKEESISISHSHHKIAISLKKEHEEPNGIDIQHLNPKIISIQSKFLSQEELKNIPTKDEETLGYYWSIKEALFKVYGKKDIFLKENIHILEFDKEKQEAIGKISCPNFNQSYKVQFELIDNYTLAYIANG